MLLRFDDAYDLAQALYYAQISAVQMAFANPHDAPITILFQELTEDAQQEWQSMAARLAALHEIWRLEMPR